MVQRLPAWKPFAGRGRGVPKDEWAEEKCRTRSVPYQQQKDCSSVGPQTPTNSTSLADCQTFTFNLNDIDGVFQKQIAERFQFVSGVKFSQSSKVAQMIVDDSKAVWHLPSLNYKKDSRIVRRDWIDSGSLNTTTKFCAEQFYGVDKVLIYSCSITYLKGVIVLELNALGAVGELDACLQNLSNEDMRLLVEAAKPDTLTFADRGLDVVADIFKNVKNLVIRITSRNVQLYWTTRKLFELARNRKTLRLSFRFFLKEFCSIFLENWRRGESTSSLEKLTVRMSLEPPESGTGDVSTNRTEVQTLLAGFIKTEDGYSVERQGGDRLRISLEFGRNVHAFLIDFHFS